MMPFALLSLLCVQTVLLLDFRSFMFRIVGILFKTSLAYRMVVLLSMGGEANGILIIK